MSIQSSIMGASAKVQRRLFDNNINSLGREVNGIHIHTVEDKYGNRSNEVINQKKNITVVVRYPSEMPLERIKGDMQSIRVTENKTFFFDLLPIELFSKWEDEVETGDYIIHLLYDDKDRPMPIILRTSEYLGAFTSHLVWHKHYCSPFRGQILEPIKLAMEELLSGANG